MEICSICFEYYLAVNERDHQCPESYACGACGEVCDSEDGIVELNSGYIEFTHKPELCPAQDELENN